MKSVMNFFIPIYIIFWMIFQVQCAKNYRFLSIESCTSDNELIAVTNKCEADGIFLTINVDVKQPVTKLMVSFKTYKFIILIPFFHLDGCKNESNEQ